jgi:predicted transcriptional regulator
MKPPKAMTIRLSAEQAEELETVASVDNQPVSEVIRAAIAGHIEIRRGDDHFQQGLRERLQRAERLLKTREGGAAQGLNPGGSKDK